MSEKREYKVGDFVFCETLATTGAWHIRRLGDAKKMEGLPFGENRRALCGLRVTWDIHCEISKISLINSDDRPGHPCSTCKGEYLETIA